MKKGNLIVWGVIILAFAGIGGFLGVKWWLREQAAKPFNAQAAQLMETKGNKDSTPYLKGKIVVFDEGTRKVDKDVFFDLPDDLRAKTPEEVATVVVVTWTEKTIDYYEGNVPAIQQTGSVKVVDYSSKQTLGIPMQFTGPEPPMKIKKNSSENKARRPVKEIVEFVKNLPKK